MTPSCLTRYTVAQDCGIASMHCIYLGVLCGTCCIIWLLWHQTETVSPSNIELLLWVRGLKWVYMEITYNDVMSIHNHPPPHTHTNAPHTHHTHTPHTHTHRRPPRNILMLPLILKLGKYFWIARHFCTTQALTVSHTHNSYYLLPSLDRKQKTTLYYELYF